MTGASFTGFTVKINDVESKSSPSATDTSTTISPLKSWAGVIVKLSPSIDKAASSLEAEKVNVSPSTSLADNESVKLVSSSILWSWIRSITGASFTDKTFKLKLCSTKNSPSKALTVISTFPYQFKNGVTVIVVPINEISTFPEWEVSKAKNGPSTSVTSKSNTSGTSSSVTWSLISKNISESFIGS